MSSPRLALAANRPIGAYAATVLRKYDWPPVCLLLAESPSADNSAGDIQEIFPDVPLQIGREFREGTGVALLGELKLDLILCVHFPYLLPPAILSIPSRGCLNLDPSYLPWNRGWHTSSWAILENTPAGASLHWMDEDLDTGPIALRRDVPILPHDTGHTLYGRILECEQRLLDEAVPRMLDNTLGAEPQEGSGTFHKKSDLSKISSLQLDEKCTVRETLALLRALTTSHLSEAAWFRESGDVYRVHVSVTRERDSD